MKHAVYRKLLSLVLAFCLLAAFLPPLKAQAAGSIELPTTVPHTQQDSSLTNYFVLAAGKWENGNETHTWSKAVDAANPEATYYEVHFTGHKIDVYAGKNRPMGKVEYFIDNQSKGIYDLYNSSNVLEDLIATFDGLTEGEHVLKAVATGQKNDSATNCLIDCGKVVVYNSVSLVEPLYGSIVNDDLQYVQEDINIALAADTNAKTLNAWRNDIAVSQIFLAAGNSSLANLTATSGDFTRTDGAGTIDASNVDLSFIQVVQAYTGMPGWGDSHGAAVPTGSRADAAEVLMGNGPINLDAGKAQGLWVSIKVPKDTASGTYRGEITVSAQGLTEKEQLTFTYTLNVASSVLPDAEDFKDGFDIELWQNPYASAEYYDVTPFSEEHFKILTPIMEKYKSIGGHAITTTIVEDAWARQTYSQNDVHIPSMVKWSKTADGAWLFDYTDFDKWISFNIDTIGIGDKIVCYSTIPWTNEIRYLDAAGTKQVISKSSTAEWNAAWTAFLTDLMTHMESKGWKDRTYIGMDERGITAGALDLVDAVKGSDGKPFKKAGAMDNMDAAHQALSIRIDDLSVGSIAIKGDKSTFADMLAKREAAGLSTAVYTCTGHIPSSFSLSAPGESYWTMMYSYSVGAAGFMRWAYDSWVADPLRDTTHSKFEAGDCFLIFPDEKDAQNPTAHSSLRLEKMAQGVRDVNKLMAIKENCPAMESAVDALLASVRPTYDSSGYYLTESGKEALAADMKTLRQGIAGLTEEYEERLATGDTKKLNMRPTIPLVRLPEENQSDVDGPYVEGHERQYLGQPDMIMLPDETLVTVFPVGHGHGPLVMKKSMDRGESWTEIETPESWARSLETPTMYRLNMTDGTQKYVMITARPNWDYNAGTGKGGWDASISSDGLTWSEATTYHEDIGYTIVAMASLVQLRDEAGTPIDKWMGVFHNYGFYNYKTYLTFDEQGNMQWSEPELYLSEYRALEEKYHICEVGMFRAPDDSDHPNRIVALARSDYHNNVHASTMFWSDDEGETWSKPVEMQGALAGERHKALYDPISGRLVITFREIIWDTNENGVFEGANDWLAGDWIAWVGTYEDLMERNEGQYRILLDEDWANNTYSGDTGYSGVQVYPDGTFVLDSYGHWDKEFSQSGKYGVRTDRCWIRQAKFTLAEMDALYEKALEEQVEEIPSAVLAENASANSWTSSTSGTDGGPAWAFDTQARWWHSNYGSVTAENVNGVPSETNPIWIQTGFGEPRFIKEFSYTPRSRNGCIINAYQVQLACLDDPAAGPADEDFITVKAGNMTSTTAAQTITLDKAYRATHIRIVAVGPVQGGNSYVSAQRIRIYAANTGVPLPPETISITGDGVVDNAAILYTNENIEDLPHTLQLSAAALPANADQTITWRSTHPDVAVVDENGLVTALKNGSTVIRAEGSGGIPLAYAAVTVTVRTRMERITVEQDGEAIGEDVTVYTNTRHPSHSVTLTAGFTPDNPTHPELNWTRPDGASGMISIVRSDTLGSSAAITAIAGELNVGEVTVEVASADHPEVKVSFKVRVVRSLENNVSISGTPKMGATLTADINQLVMTDAGKEALTYQWKRDGTKITGADEQTYTLTEEDIGSVISVEVTADPDTFYEGTRPASIAGTVAKADGGHLVATPTHVDCTNSSNNDGKITGLFKGRAYQYKLVSEPDTAWKDFIDNTDDETGSSGLAGTAEITGLTPGSYHVRRAETDTHTAGPVSFTITILSYEDSTGAYAHDINIERDFEGGRVLASTRRALADAEVTLTVEPSEGWELVEDTLKVYKTDAPELEIEVTDGKFTMPDFEVTVTAQFRKLRLSITHELANIDCDQTEHNHEVEYGDTPTINLTANPGYTMPSKVDVVSTESGEPFSGYRYSHTAEEPDRATITFNQGVTENLTISGAGIPKTFAVNYTLRSGLSAPEADAPRTVLYHEAYAGRLTAAEGYRLPENIVITMGGTAFTEFTYEEGTITIDAGKITDNLVITASGIDASKPVIPVTGIELNPNASVLKGMTITLTAVVHPENATDPMVVWSSSNPTVASVDEETGVVTGLSVGTAIMTATTMDGGLTAECIVTVTDNTPVNPPVDPGTVIPPRPNTSTTTTTNPDGSTTTTVTDNKTGTVTETTKKPDGSTEVVETKKDGTVTATVTDPEGGKVEKITTPEKDVAITVVDKDGETLAKLEIPAEIPELEAGRKFIDVPDSHYAADAINNMAALGVVNGVGNQLFNREGDMKRGDLTLILSRMSDGGTGHGLYFDDVPADSYYADGVAWAAKTGVVTGYSDSTFGPEDTITREQLAVMLYRYAKLLNLDTEASTDALNTFTDGTSTSGWAKDGVAWCIQNGILQGRGNGVLDPGTNVIRADVALMLQRFINLVSGK